MTAGMEWEDRPSLDAISPFLRPFELSLPVD